jgi:hypothetical protein
MPRVIRKRPLPGHNYVPKVIDFALKTSWPPGKVGHIAVRHDDWCGVWQGGRCNCNPDVERIPAPPGWE